MTKLNMSFGSKVTLLVCAFVVGLFVASNFVLLLPRMGVEGRVALALSTIVQDVLVFIFPAVLVSMFGGGCTRALRLNVRPSWRQVLIVAAVYVVSLPAMNWLVEANKLISLPPSMHGVEQWMRASEDAALAVTGQLLGSTSLLAMLCMVAVVGFLAALSAEMFFRGALLGMSLDRGMRAHAAVWIVAFVFSAFHMQFYGFFPRLLLGAWLGYLLLWSRSLWLPVIAHTINNAVVVVVTYLANVHRVPAGSLDTLGVPAPGQFPWLAAASAVATAAVIVAALRSKALQSR